MLPALKEFARRGRRRRRKMNNSSSRLVQITHLGNVSGDCLRGWRACTIFLTSSTPSYRLKNGSKQCSRTGSAIAAILKLDSTLHTTATALVIFTDTACRFKYNEIHLYDSQHVPDGRVVSPGAYRDKKKRGNK